MKTYFLMIVAIFSYSFAVAQWSTQIGNPTPIAVGTGSQTFPQTATWLTGNTFISYLDNSSGTQALKLKCLDFEGFEFWNQPQGLELPGFVYHQYSSDYDLICDQGGSAILASSDNRNGNSDIYLYKVNSAGQFTWMQTGINASAQAGDYADDYDPSLLNTSDNSTYIAWTKDGQDTAIYLQRIGFSGNSEWTIPLTLASQNMDYYAPELLPSDDNSTLLVYLRAQSANPQTNRQLRIAKISAAGLILWDHAVSEMGDIPTSYEEPVCVSDQSNGACIVWYDDRDMIGVDRPYMAHIAANGVFSTEANGSLVITDTFYNYYKPIISYNSEHSMLVVLLYATDSNHSMHGAYLQVMTPQGNRLYGNSGDLLDVLDDETPKYLYIHIFNENYQIFESRLSTYDAVFDRYLCSTYCLPGFYSGIHYRSIASDWTYKQNPDFAEHSSGWTICVWEDNAQNGNIMAQRVFLNGSVGEPFGPPENLTATFIPPSSIRLNWQAPQISIPEYYLILGLGDLIEVPPNLTTYTVHFLPVNNYHITMRAVYPGNDWSDPSNAVDISTVSDNDPQQIPTPVKISPNPFSNHTKLSWFNARYSSTGLSLYNIRGQLLHRIILPNAQGEQSHSLDRGDLGNGIYFLKIDREDRSEQHRILIID